jgi:hypothetical protein
VDDDTVKFKGILEKMSGLHLVMSASEVGAKTIILDSPGGLMVEASIIANYLRDSGVSVIIEKDTMCVSACAYAAMTAEKLTINGKLAFHPPFFPTINTSESLYSIIHRSNSVTLELSKWFLNAGYSLSLLKIIYDNTNNTEFMVFENAGDLHRFKSSDILYLPENFEEYFSIVQSEE